MDMEKIMQGLEHCRLICVGANHNSCKGCPYQGNYDCADTLKTDALELLKEHNERIKTLEYQLEMITKWRADAGAFD